MIPDIHDLQRHIEAAARRGIAAHLLPGMTVDEITRVERRMNEPLTLALRDLFRATAGISVEGSDVVDFRGTLPFRVTGLEHALPIAVDDSGNTWVLDTDDAGCLTILFVSFDPSVVIIQSCNLSAFLADVIEASGANRQMAPLIARIWRDDPYAQTRLELFWNRDPVVASFARSLPPGYLVYDLRQRTPGMGFPWTPAASIPIRRFGAALLFAARPARARLLRLPQIARRLWSRFAESVRLS